MTSDQPTLFKPPKPIPVIGNLTDRQAQAWELIRSTPGGVTADEIGAHLHSLQEKRPHPADERCMWCGTAGKEVATSAALKPLVVRRHGGKYEPRNPADRAVVSSQLSGELPGETFADIFGMGDAA